MKIVNKALTLMMTGAMIFTLSGCGDTSEQQKNNDETIDIICTTYPQYDWARQVIGENNERVTLNLIIDNGMDVHNYQPSAEDMIEIAGSDFVIYNGGNSESWVEEAVANNPQIKTLELMTLLEEQMVEEEIVEGMVHEHSHEEAGHEHEETVENGDEHENQEIVEEAVQKENNSETTEYDEHIWLSLKNAIVVVEEINNAIAELDPENMSLYEQNTDNYVKELQSLDKKYEETVSTGKRDILLFADRFPFRYMVKDYGLTYYAAFPGCSAETEASFETIVFLAEKVRKHNLPYILTIDGSDKSIAESIKSNVGKEEIEILTLNSLQSVSKDSLEETTYLSVMEANLEVLKTALN